MKPRSTRLIIALLLPAVVLLALLGILLLLGPFRTKTQTMPVTAAYTDGFEVVVLSRGPDGQHWKVTSIKLGEAEQEVRADPSATFLVEDVEVAGVELSATVQRDGDSPYPIVSLSVTPAGKDRQVIESSWHYSNRTFTFKYEATDKSVRPIESSHRDLGGVSKTVYVADDASR